MTAHAGAIQYRASLDGKDGRRRELPPANFGRSSEVT